MLSCVVAPAFRVTQACRVADRVGVGVYFNTLVPLGDQVIDQQPACAQLPAHYIAEVFVEPCLHCAFKQASRLLLRATAQATGYLHHLGANLTSVTQSQGLARTLKQCLHCAVVLQMVKYGVVGLPAFMQDLQHWSHLYVAGRLHKPVTLLASQHEAEAAYHQNLRAALSTALLLLPQPESSLKVLLVLF